MRLPEFAIENHQFTIMGFALLVLAGITSFIIMPKSEDPNVQPPGSSVVVIYPGANPSDLEQLVIDPLEEAINELSDIKTINGFARSGLGIVNVEFTMGSDADDKYDKVLQKVNATREELPENVMSVETVKWSLSDIQILQLALRSKTASYREMEQEAERLQKDLERVPGVQDVSIFALPEQEVRVALNFAKLAQWHIPINQIIGAIQSTNANIPGGYVDVGGRRLNVKTSGSYQSISDIKQTVVSSAPGNLIFLKDVADVSLQEEDPTYIARTNGKRCIFITASQKPGTNIFNIYNGFRPKIAAFRQALPANMDLQMVFDQSKSVGSRVQRFFINLLQGIVLVGLVIFLAVGFRAASIVMVAVPVSILIAIFFVDISGYGLQQMSIAGLVIALGLLVDNAIVVTENSSRFMRMGLNSKEAAVEGTSQIAWAIISATATTVLAFIPIIFMKDVTGDFIRSMPVTVVYTLAASLFLSLTLTPFLASKFLRISKETKKRRIRRVLQGFIEGPYRRTLGFALEKPVRVIAVVSAVFLMSLALFPLIGVSFFPKAEKPQFFINIDLPSGTALAKTDSVARQVEKILYGIPAIQTVAVNIGNGNPPVYYNIQSVTDKSNHAQIFVQLEKWDLKRYNDTVNSLRNRFRNIPGARIELKELEQGPPVGAAITVRLIGENMDILKNIAADVEKIINSEQGTVNTYNPLATSTSDLHVRIHREKAAMLGVQLAEVDQTIRMSLAGIPVGTYQDSRGKSYDITVRSPMASTPSLTNLDHVYVSSLAGKSIPLQQIATVEFSPSPETINHYNLERTVFIESDLKSGYSTDEISRNIIKKLDAYPWLNGYRYSMGGIFEHQGTSFQELTQAVIIALIAIFSVLVLQFRSYIQPFVVFSAIPFAIIGSILALLITGETFSFTAFVGLTSLVGIVVNNSIILVDYANQLRAKGYTVVDALKEAGETRFTPIILTTGTTIGGLLPLTLGGGSLWAPMGWTIIGGLLTSTFLTLVLVPTIYKLLTKEKVIAK